MPGRVVGRLTPGRVGSPACHGPLAVSGQGGRPVDAGFVTGRVVGRSMPGLLPGRVVGRSMPGLLPGSVVGRSMPGLLPGRVVGRSMPGLFRAGWLAGRCRVCYRAGGWPVDAGFVAGQRGRPVDAGFVTGELGRLGDGRARGGLGDRRPRRRFGRRQVRLGCGTAGGQGRRARGWLCRRALDLRAGHRTAVGCGESGAGPGRGTRAVGAAATGGAAVTGDHHRRRGCGLRTGSRARAQRTDKSGIRDFMLVR